MAIPSAASTKTMPLPRRRKRVWTPGGIPPLPDMPDMNYDYGLLATRPLREPGRLFDPERPFDDPHEQATALEEPVGYENEVYSMYDSLNNEAWVLRDLYKRTALVAFWKQESKEFNEAQKLSPELTTFPYLEFKANPDLPASKCLYTKDEESPPALALREVACAEFRLWSLQLRFVALHRPYYDPEDMDFSDPIPEYAECMREKRRLCAKDIKEATWDLHRIQEEFEATRQHFIYELRDYADPELLEFSENTKWWKKELTPLPLGLACRKGINCEMHSVSSAIHTKRVQQQQRAEQPEQVEEPPSQPKKNSFHIGGMVKGGFAAVHAAILSADLLRLVAGTGAYRKLETTKRTRGERRQEYERQVQAAEDDEWLDLQIAAAEDDSSDVSQEVIVGSLPIPIRTVRSQVEAEDEPEPSDVIAERRARSTLAQRLQQQPVDPEAFRPRRVRFSETSPRRNNQHPAQMKAIAKAPCEDCDDDEEIPGHMTRGQILERPGEATDSEEEYVLVRRGYS